MELATIALIEEATGLRAYEFSAHAKSRGLADEESSSYENVSSTLVGSAIEALSGGRSGINAWVLRSRSLEAVGYLPGDILLVDSNVSAQPGDIVRADIYERNGKTETVFRIFEDPFLVAATLDRALVKPWLVDNERVAVRGVVVASFRERNT